jgi:single-stranded-DNA-specific exonuclease
MASCRNLASRLDLPLFAAELLCQRGISTFETAKSYLSPKLKDLPSPFLFKDMDKAIGLIVDAMKNQWPVVIYGDYDVDGICATALLVDFLILLELDVHWHVPNRLTDGYGMTSEALESIQALVDTPALLITVDNGVSAVNEVLKARDAGFHVIITDHHEPPPVLPESDALINPKQKNCRFPFSELSGTGVVFFLVIAIRYYMITNGYWQKNNSPNLKNYLDLVALGTVADVMPLNNVNRILVRAGTEVLTERIRPGIWALCEQIGLREGNITTEDISFRIAPRINAAGRLGSPETAAKLLMSKDVQSSLQAATVLEEKNKKRRIIEKSILPEAVAQCEEQNQENCSALVTYKKDWHPGVLGIVASRLCDRFHLPAIALTDDPNQPGIVKGSGRSAGGINLFKAVNQCGTILKNFGGHQQAVGLSLNKDNLPEFKIKFNRQVGEQAKNLSTRNKVVLIDKELQGNEPDWQFISLLRRFEPFGEGNPEPVFLVKNKKLFRVSLVKGNHLRFCLRLNGQTFKGIGFGMGDRLTIARERVDMAFTFKHTMYRGEKRVEIMAVDVSSAA